MRPEINEELVDRVIEKWKHENKIAIDVPKSKIIEEIMLKYIESASKIKTSSDKRDKLLRKFIQVGHIIKKPRHQSNSVMINSTKFGSITIGNKKYDNDVLVSYKDTVKEGKTNSRHLISKKEFALLLEENPGVIVVGTGQEGCLKISSDVSDIAENKGIEIVESTTPEAIKKFNQLYASGRKVVGYMHVTC
jgi:hypothetical protein